MTQTAMLKNKVTPNRFLRNCIEWKATLEVVTPLFIGGKRISGEKVDAKQNSLMDREGNFIIPGSTLRGIFRKTIQDMLCFILNEELDKQRDLVNCYMESLFGCVAVRSGGKKGLVWVGDVKVIKDNNNTDKFITPIDRITQKPLVPITLLSIKPGACFTVRVLLENPLAGHLGLMALLFRDLANQEVSIGAGKTRGLGMVKLKRLETKVTIYSMKDTDKMCTADGILIPIDLSEWDKKINLVIREFSIRNCDDIKRTLAWLKPGIESLKKAVEGVIT